MKKRNLYLSLALAVLTLGQQSCDNLPDEQFDKYVLMTRNGFIDREIVYNASGKATTEVSVSVSGSSDVAHDVEVEVEVYPDTLDQYNFEKFRTDSASYYDLAEHYTIPHPKLTIRKGEAYGVFDVVFDVKQMDKYKDFVLPLRIKSASDYLVSPKASRVMLMHILLTNFFSGAYGMSAQFDGAYINLNRTLSVIDEQTCFTYIGNIETTDENKADYRLEISVNPTDSLITLNAPGLDLQQEPSDRQNLKNVMVEDETEQRLYLQYSYVDPRDGRRKSFDGYLSQTITDR